MEYRQGDVRDPAALRDGLRGRRRRRAPRLPHHRQRRSREQTRAINVDGTLNAFRAAAAAGAPASSTRPRSRPTASTPTTRRPSTRTGPCVPPTASSTRRRRPRLDRCLQEAAAARTPAPRSTGPAPPIVVGPDALGGQGPRSPGAARRRRPARRAARPAAPPAAPASPCSRRRCRCSSCTRTTSATRSGAAWWAPGRPAPTTSPVTASSPATRCCARSARTAGARPRRLLRRPRPAPPRGCRLPPTAEWVEAAAPRRSSTPPRPAGAGLEAPLDGPGGAARHARPRAHARRTVRADLEEPVVLRRRADRDPQHPRDADVADQHARRRGRPARRRARPVAGGEAAVEQEVRGARHDVGAEVVQVARRSGRARRPVATTAPAVSSACPSAASAAAWVSAGRW